LVNSFIIYCEFAQQKQTFFDYKLQVTEALLQLAKPKRGRPSASPLPLEAKPRKCSRRKFTASSECRFSNIGNHWPLKATDKNEKTTKARCEYCSIIRGQESKTTWKCSQCQAFLCLDSNKNCFYDFHHTDGSDE